MKPSDIIRQILDIIDSLEQSNNDEHTTGCTVDLTSNNSPPEELSQFKHILNLLSTKEYSTRPDPAYADINAVTVDAGGGLNGPKHPADIRGSTVAIYPDKQYRS